MHKNITRGAVAVAAAAALVACTPIAAAAPAPAAQSAAWDPAAVPTTADGTKVTEYAGMLPACQDEDLQYVFCVWDAATRGNGAGRSYFVDTDGTVTEIPAALAGYLING